jgi:hypothetical protein
MESNQFNNFKIMSEQFSRYVKIYDVVIRLPQQLPRYRISDAFAKWLLSLRSFEGHIFRMFQTPAGAAGLKGRDFRSTVFDVVCS